ncbi:glycosyltransferase [Azospirillum sp. TSO35-2]|uniref:glycosyltransferase n=1 Tax=Azospirillum sp. TSO35-2 TaxID=716796 RepID=UPI001304CA18|nr:glycosyltransferase [Azospirillum sp. TSO35-2]
MNHRGLLDVVLRRIRAREAVAGTEVMEALAAGPLQERAAANIQIAQAYLDAGRNDDALHCVERAWLLGFRTNALTRFLAHNLAAAGRQRDALDRLREAALLCARSNDVAGVCETAIHFHTLASSINLPIHDSILTELVMTTLKSSRPELHRARSGPLRIGYVFWGEEQENNVLPPVLIETARNHDRERFEPVFFSYHQEDTLLRVNKTFPLWLSRIRAMGAGFIGNDARSSAYESALSLSRKIVAQEIDVLVPLGQMGLSFLVAGLRPAPLIVGLDLGNPHVYSSPALDHIISPSMHRHTMEQLCDATQVRGVYTAHSEVPPPPLSRAAIGAGPDEIVVMTSGSAEKFLDTGFLRTLGEVAAECPNVRLYLVGPRPESPAGDFFRRNFPDEVGARIVLAGYREDFASFIRASDIYVDTYPVGGGYAMYEVLSAGIPAVTFSQKLAGLFNKLEHYSPAAVFCTGTGMVVPGDDVSNIKQRILELVADPGMRRRLGARGPGNVQAMLDTRAFTAEVERVILDLAAARPAA